MYLCDRSEDYVFCCSQLTRGGHDDSFHANAECRVDLLIVRALQKTLKALNPRVQRRESLQAIRSYNL